MMPSEDPPGEPTDRQPVETDELLRIAGRMARFGGWSVDLERGVVHWSDEVYRIHGMPPGATVRVEEGINRYAPEWRSTIREHFRACAEEGVPYDLELEILSGTDTRTWVRVIGEPVWGPDGRIIRVQGAFQDISFRKAEEARREEVEGRLARTLESMSDAFFALDRAWRFTFLNTEASRLLRRDKKDLLGKVLWDAFPEANEGPFRERYEWAVRHQRPVDFEAFYPPLGIWVWIHAYPSEHGLAVHFQDISGRRAVEERLRRTETLFREIAENIDSVLWIASPQGQVEYVSGAFEGVWGRDAGEPARSRANWPHWVHPDDLERMEEARPGQPDGSYDVEYRIVRPDGGVRLIWDRAFPLRDEGGRVYRVVGVASDITERRELEERLRHAQKLEVVGQLAGGVAHDFNNLLTVIKASSEMLLEELPADSLPGEAAGEIRDQAARGARLTRQLLAFSRRQILDERLVDLGDLLEGVQPTLRRVIPASIEIVCTRGDGALPLRVDPDQLHQAILNLVVNATDAIAGRGRIRLAVDRVPAEEVSDLPPDATAVAEYVRLSVEDTGPGMPPEVTAQVFEPFFTTKQAGEGTGLGLSMVYGMVRQSGGHVQVESELGVGSTFRLLFPRVHDDPVPGTPEAVRSSRDPSHRASATVLLVEDEPPVRRAVARMLRRCGHRVLEAEGGEEGLGRFRQSRGSIDVLVTDLVMPDMSGTLLIDRLRELKPDLPVVLISGHSPLDFPPPDRDSATALLEKPFGVAEIDRVIQDALASTREARN